jgi:hypothetical protein
MAIAFPFIEVNIDTSALLPAMQRAPGVVAIVGAASGATAPTDTPIVVTTTDDIDTQFRNGTTETGLSRALKAAMMQDPGPEKIYGVRTGSGGTAWESALASLEGADDVTFVALADASVKSGSGSPNAPIAALKTHCEMQSAGGNKRIGVAHINPGIAKSATYATDVIALATPLKSTSGRMVMIAARGAVDSGGTEAQVAAAAAGAIAGQPVASSMVLKKIRGIAMPLAGQYGPGEISALSTDGIIPVIDPALISGESLHFAEGTTYTTDATLKYVDLVRLIDDVEFRLKAGLVGMIGDARISRSGLADIIRQSEGILGVVQMEGGITGFSVIVPVYEALSLAEAARSAAQVQMINTARSQRLVDMVISIVIGPAVHRLRIALQPRF